MPILFRPIINPRPPNWLPIHWYIEYHDAEADLAFPLGVAYVTVYPRKTLGPVLNFILVTDQYRRQGVDWQFIQACKQRWPDIWLTNAISSEGEALLRNADRVSRLGSGEQGDGLPKTVSENRI